MWVGLVGKWLGVAELLLAQEVAADRLHALRQAGAEVGDSALQLGRKGGGGREVERAAGLQVVPDVGLAAQPVVLTELGLCAVFSAGPQLAQLGGFVQGSPRFQCNK